MGLKSVQARRSAIILLSMVATAGCGSTMAQSPAPGQAPNSTRAYTPADVTFMSAMVGHHAQALDMARMAPSHGASAAVQRLAERIINAQQDEILTFQTWLRDRGEPVPEARAAGMKHVMNGVEHEMPMPGMLTEAQMKQLDEARGREFDRLFLSFMIQHHQGALQMVNELFSSQGAAQDNTVFKMASDISAEQTSEIARMQTMLFELLLERGP